MKTKIVIRTGWKIIKTYDFMLTMREGDSVTFGNIEYRVFHLLLEVETDTIFIIIEE